MEIATGYKASASLDPHVHVGDWVLLRRSGVIGELIVERISPSGNYFQGLDARATLFGRTPDAYDRVWYEVDAVIETVVCVKEKSEG